MTEGVIVALIMSGAGLITGGINAWMIYKSKKLGNNPYPCKENTEKIKEIDEKLDKACERISRIEGKLNSK